jgi:hypothetical protein
MSQGIEGGGEQTRRYWKLLWQPVCGVVEVAKARDLGARLVSRLNVVGKPEADGHQEISRRCAQFATTMVSGPQRCEHFVAD